jgi:hypothetical protein
MRQMEWEAMDSEGGPHGLFQINIPPFPLDLENHEELDS